MSSSFPGQHDDEEILMVFHQHPLVMRKPLIYGLLGVLLAIVPFTFIQIYSQPGLPELLFKVALGIIAFILLYWTYHWISWYYSVYIVSNQRVMEIRQKGLFNRQVSEWDMDVIQNVNYHVRGFQAVLFGFGDITLQTYLGEMVMPTIHKPTQTHERIVKIVRQYGTGSTPPPVSGSIS